MKRCYVCNQHKPLNMFSKDKSRADGKCSRCKECRSWHYSTQVEQVAATSRNYHAVHRQQRNAHNLAYYHSNKGSRSLAMSAWYQGNRDQVQTRVAHRRAAKLCATPEWADLHLIQEFYREARRLTDATGVLHHVDHIVPLNSPLVCGLHVHHNLQVLTGPDNDAKGNRFWPDMFPLNPTLDMVSRTIVPGFS